MGGHGGKAAPEGVGGEPERGMAGGSDQNTSYTHARNRQGINMKLSLKRKLIFNQKVSNLSGKLSSQIQKGLIKRL